MTSPCVHFTQQAVQLPGPAQNVYREDCTQCFGSIDDPEGLNVCLWCFNGFCPPHSELHTARQQHSLFLNIKRRKKHRDEPVPKLTKLAIAAESEEDRYEAHYEVFCSSCPSGPFTDLSGKVKEVVDAVIKAPTFARQAEVKAWEQELTPCEHTLTLSQEASRSIASQDLGQCSLCDLKENLWLCLTCGNLGCGRSQFGSDVKGNSHALAHGSESHHPVAVKLGSISPEGTADIYCYSCNDEHIDPDLKQHLANFGIQLADREKTEKSLTEMQIEQNLRWDFSMTTEDGQELRPLFGKGLTGLKNLGNSCYLSSTFQCLFSLPAFQTRYYHSSSEPPQTSAPAEDLETQLQKLADGLLSGKWAKPDAQPAGSESGDQIPHQPGLAPSMLKHLIGRGHPEFSTMRQQDAFEFLLHVFKLITRSSQSLRSADPTKSFRFQLEERLQCRACNKVRYRPLTTDNISIPVPARRNPASADKTDDKPEFVPVPLSECLERFTGVESVDLTCASCGSKDGYFKRTLFKTFPDTLAVNAQRFELVNWVPTKLDIPVVVGDAPFSLDVYQSNGLTEGEVPLPEEAEVKATFKPNEAGLQQLEAMGFPRVRCEKALHATGNSDAEAAMNWLFSHMEDADIDNPVELMDPSGGSSAAAGGASVSQESLDMVIAMGIDPPKARKALKETGGDIERAVDWVFSHPDDPGDVDDAPAESAAESEVPGSAALPANYRLKAIICHKGASIHAGHYVAFVRKEIEGEEEKGSQWVLFNDEKVVRAADVEEMKKFAYVYFFEKV